MTATSQRACLICGEPISDGEAKRNAVTAIEDSDGNLLTRPEPTGQAAHLRCILATPLEEPR